MPGVSTRSRAAAPPPAKKRRTRLKDDGVSDEQLNNSNAGAGILDVHPRWSSTERLFEKLSSEATRTIASMSSARKILEDCSKMCEKAEGRVQRLEKENAALRACIGEVVDGAKPEHTPAWLLRTARNARKVQKMREDDLNDELWDVEDLLSEKSQLLDGARAEVRSLTSRLKATTKDLETEKRASEDAERRWFHASAQTKSALDKLKKDARRQEKESAASRSALKKERARREEAEDAALCVICLAYKRSRVLLPCTHLVVCDRCSLVSSCPICRTLVLRTERVIIS